VDKKFMDFGSKHVQCNQGVNLQKEARSKKEEGRTKEEELRRKN
jgi:hypothetical protein